MKKVVCFGELLLRLSPTAPLQIRQANAFGVSFAGAEANVAVALNNLGDKSMFVSRFPCNPIGESATEILQKFGIDMSYTKNGGNRMGILYYEKGAGFRPSRVYYDRAGSSFACSSIDEYDWDAIFKDSDWFHFSGITPALGGNLEKILETAVHIAKEKKICVSCDINYRPTLWSKEDARNTMLRYLPYLDYCVSPEDLFLEAGEELVETDKKLIEKFGVKAVIHSHRKMNTALKTEYSVSVVTDIGHFISDKYETEIVDRLGCGDAMFGGFIFAMRKWNNFQTAVDFGAAVGCLKHSTDGDFSCAREKDVEYLLAGENSGRVLR